MGTSLFRCLSVSLCTSLSSPSLCFLYFILDLLPLPSFISPSSTHASLFAHTHTHTPRVRAQRLTSGYCKYSQRLISKYFPAASSQRLCSAHSGCRAKSYGGALTGFLCLSLVLLCPRALLLLVKSTCGQAHSLGGHILYHKTGRKQRTRREPEPGPQPYLASERRERGFFFFFYRP